MQNISSSLSAVAALTVAPGKDFARRPVSNRTTALRESSAQPARRAPATVRLRKPGLLYPAPSAARLPQPAPFAARLQRRRSSAASPTTEAVREYRRAARAAEMSAWEAVMPDVEKESVSASSISATRTEKVVTALLLSLATVLAGIAWLAAHPDRLQATLGRLEAFIARLAG